MVITDFLPFQSGALNASFIAICILLVPFPLMVFSAIKMKFVTKNNLLLFGFGFALLSMLIAPLFTGLIDLIGSYETKLERCQAGYVYKKLAGVEIGESCEGLSESEARDLSGFKSFIIMASVIMTVMALSLGVNLLASAMSMSQERLALEELYNKVSEIKASVDKQAIVLKRFLWAIVALLIVAIGLSVYSHG